MSDDQMSFGFGREERDDGMDRVRRHTPGFWIAHFERTILDYPVGTRITVEDIRSIVGDPPNHINAIGAQMHACIKKGWLKKIGFVQAHRSIAHARTIGIYERI